MLENNNKKTIIKLTKRSIKSNKIRNLFAVLAIILTTFMISSIFSIGYSFIQNSETMQIRMKGTIATVTLNDPTIDQINSLKKQVYIDSVGIRINAGKIVNEQLADNATGIGLFYYDQTEFTKHRKPAISNVIGSYPTDTYGIMMSQWSLGQLGIKNPAIGMNITIDYKVNGEIKSNTFILTGYFMDYNITSDYGVGLVSESFVEENQLDKPENKTATISLMKKSDKYLISRLIEENMLLSNNQQFNFTYDSTDQVNEQAMGTITVVIILGFFITISGYLLIYNVLYIAITKDIQFYGLLKTIGTSPTQIKKIVNSQATFFSLIGIPIGLIFGFLFSFILIPYSMAIFGSSGINAMPTKVYFHPIIFVGATLFSYITVRISCIKPARTAGKVSPVEATHYIGTTLKKKLHNRKTTKGGKLYRMALYNVFREKKRAAVVFISLFMGIITFLSVNTFISSVSLDNYLDTYVTHDFEIKSIPPIEDKFDDTFLQTIKDLKGVKKVMTSATTYARLDFDEPLFHDYAEYEYTIYQKHIGVGTVEEFLNYLESNSDKYCNWITGIDTSYIETLNDTLEEPIDIEAFEKGELAILTTPHLDRYKEKIASYIGESFTIEQVDTGNKATVIFAALSGDDFPFGGGGAVGAPNIFISNQAIDKLSGKAVINNILIDVDPRFEEEIRYQLVDMISSMRSVELISKTEQRAQFLSTMTSMNILGSGMCLILVLIGILNFVNIMVTGINGRLHELAVMESVGMTKNQIIKMLRLEGLYYWGITSVLILTLGSCIIYWIGKLSVSIADYAVFHYPVLPLSFILAIILLICIAVPGIVYKISSKKAIVERLRENIS